MLPGPSRVPQDPIVLPKFGGGLLAHPSLLAVMVICTAVELILQGADWGLWGRLRHQYHGDL